MRNQADIHSEERQVFIIPPVIIKDIGGKKLSLLRAKGSGEYHLELGEDVVFKLKEWEYHALNALFSFGGDKYDTLLVNTNDRFGLSLTRYDIDVLLDRIAKRKLFDKDNAPKHPLTKPFYDGTAKIENIAGKTVNNNLAAGVRKNVSGSYDFKEKITSVYSRIKADAKSFFKASEQFADEMQSDDEFKDIQIEPEAAKFTVLFNPMRFLRKHNSLISKGSYLLYALPVLFIAALVILSNNPQMISHDLPSAISGFGLVAHLLLGLVTVSAFVTFATSAVAFSYTATVKAISVAYFFGFIPRFVPVIEDTEKLSREQKMWVHATALLARLGVFGLSVLMWYNSRHLGGVISEFFAFLSFTAILSFFVAACPFYKSSGYRFLVQLLNEPNLWGKSITALFNKVNKDVYSPSDKNVLVAYAITCVFFTFALAAVVFAMAYHWFEIEIGKNALFVVFALVVTFFLRLSKEVKKINEEYKRNLNFVRWREGAFPTVVEEVKTNEEKPDYRKKYLLIASVVLLLVPYNYQPSGQVVIMPINQQKLSTDIAGIIDEVYYEGGEFVRQGTVIAKLSVHDYAAQLAILKAKREEKIAQINFLKSMPTPEQVAVAEEKLQLARISSKYSQAECNRQKPLHDSGGISESQMAIIEEQCAIDRQNIMIAEANLNEIAAGASYEEIAAAELSLLPLEAEIRLYEDKIERSHFKMPFDGKLTTLGLKERQGQFLELGSPLAAAHDDKQLKAILKVPEDELSYIKVGSEVDVKTAAYPGKTFKAVVSVIEPDVEEHEGKRMISMIISFNNNEKMLKSGLSGYAKVDGGTQMLGEVLLTSIMKFVTVELWAWI